LAKVDLSKYLTYIRYQWGSGCFNYALMAVWDILNEINCPNSPNMSLAFAQHLFHRPDRWMSKPWAAFPGYYGTLDGRWHPMPLVQPIKDHPYESNIMKTNWMQTFGNPTEGSMPSIGNWGYDAAQLTREAVNEASNYRMNGTPTKIEISTTKFKEELNKYNPIRLAVGNHVVAIVGYDDSLKRFKFVNDFGDTQYAYVANNPMQGGAFATFTYDEVDSKNSWRGYLEEALIFQIIPPKPVPTARIWVKHNSNRNNINMWLSVEDSPKPKKKIWPPWELTVEHKGGWDAVGGGPENVSHTLNFTVRLPSEFIWPPSPDNRLVLDLYDSDALDSKFSKGGGELVDFRANFGNHIVNCKEILNNHPNSIKFKSNEHKRFYIPE